MQLAAERIVRGPLNRVLWGVERHSVVAVENPWCCWGNGRGRRAGLIGSSLCWIFRFLGVVHKMCEREIIQISEFTKILRLSLLK
jgi:hypothetical protein